jgi:hypothetical protein
MEEKEEEEKRMGEEVVKWKNGREKEEEEGLEAE